MGALMNAGKRPLGLVFEILEAQYTEEKAAWRRGREELIKRFMIYDLELDVMFGEPPHTMTSTGHLDCARLPTFARCLVGDVCRRLAGGAAAG